MGVRKRHKRIEDDAGRDPLHWNDPIRGSLKMANFEHAVLDEVLRMTPESAKPFLMIGVASSKDAPVVIDLSTGAVTIREDVTLDEASRAFWRAVEAIGVVLRRPEVSE